jgi:hypothetical protein
MTNRDLYLTIRQLTSRPDFARRPLADFLRCLRDQAMQRRSRDEISADDFVEMLIGATEGVVHEAPDGGSTVPAFTNWLSYINRQIDDLDEMGRDGTASMRLRYLGVKASGSKQFWFNFDPATFLECACAGTFGGWEEADAAGREHVTGNAADSPSGNSDGEGQSILSEPVVSLGPLGWQKLQGFLQAGQMYE